ncbi:MAG TPA: short-chain dehydrogenase, partial [Myxococcaceae bacterium]|nr:short-chain dehydrogenase [Myxococcaceae bacterium]
RLEGTGVTANCLHPGVIASGFARNNPGWLGRAWGLMGPFLSGVEKGAQTSLYLASSPEVEGVSGAYFKKCRAVKSSPASHDAAAAKRLWEVSAALTRNGVEGSRRT